jgi:hypothetical protein
VQSFPIKHLTVDVAYARVKDAPSKIAGLRRLTYDPTSHSILVQGTPDAIKEFDVLMQTIDVESNAVSVAIKNVSAQYLHDLLTTSMSSPSGQGNWIPAGVTLFVDARTNRIVVDGPVSGVKEMELLIPQFDVKPLSVELEVRGMVLGIDRAIDTKSSVVNNSSWSYTDESSKTVLKVVPRINGDGTILLVMAGEAMGSPIKQFLRTNSAQTLYLRIGGPGTEEVNVSHFQFERPIDEEAFLTGAPMSSLDPKFAGDDAQGAMGELRLIVRASVKK